MTYQHKRKGKNYVVPKDAINFREIARIMTTKGYRCNHATARNVLYAALKKLLRTAIIEGSRGDNEVNVNQAIALVLNSAELQEALADVLRQAYQQDNA